MIQIITSKSRMPFLLVVVMAVLIICCCTRCDCYVPTSAAFTASSNGIAPLPPAPCSAPSAASDSAPPAAARAHNPSGHPPPPPAPRRAPAAPFQPAAAPFSPSHSPSPARALAWVFGAPKICEGARIWCRRNRAKVLVLVPSNAKRCRKMLQNGHKTAI